MGCSSSRGVSVPQPVPQVVRLRSAVELCTQEPRALEQFYDDELSMLDKIVEDWSRQNISGSDARQQILQRILRNRTHASLGLQSLAGAATQAGAQGAASGAAIGQAIAQSLSSTASSALPASRSSTASAASTVAATALGVLGAFAGGLVGGVGSAIMGGARAGLRSRSVFIFVDRIFLKATHEQAWEMAAQQLELLGERPPVQAIEDAFLLKIRSVFDSTETANGDLQTPQGVWLRLVQLCLSLEILHHIDAPTVRVELPAELVGETIPDQLRLDHEFVSQRVSQLAAELLGDISKKSAGGMTACEIDKRCPVVPLGAPVDDVCPVCLEEFEVSGSVRRLPCGHNMHKECCEAWLKTAGTCPTCRHDVRYGK